MKKIIMVLAIVFIGFGIANAQTRLLNNSRGFVLVTDNNKIIIDHQNRVFDTYQAYKKDNLTYVKYKKSSRIIQSDLIITDGKNILFDSHKIVKDIPLKIYNKIITNFYYQVRSNGYQMPPEYYNFRPNQHLLSIKDITYKTKMIKNMIVIDINHNANYKQFLRCYFKKDGKFVGKITNNTGIVACTKYPIATINDPDGYTNIRSGPGIQYAIIDKIYDQEIFAIRKKFSKWSKVITPKSKTGFIHNSRIKIIHK